jgi:choloylglycine hydrolase
LADWLRGYQSGPSSPIDFAFDALSSVAQISTRWTIVFDIANRQVHFRTAETPVTRVARLDAFEYSCAPFRWKFIDMDYEGAGDVSANFQPYNDAANLDLLRRTYQVINPNIPLANLQPLAAFPSTLKCEPAKLPGRRERGKH